jgi:transmembrane sensor
MQRRLVFDDAPIARVIDEFNLYNETQLRLDDSELASLRITGVFNADDPGALVKYLERVQGVTATRTAEDSGAQVTLRGSHIP